MGVCYYIKYELLADINKRGLNFIYFTTISNKLYNLY